MNTIKLPQSLIDTLKNEWKIYINASPGSAKCKPFKLAMCEAARLLNVRSRSANAQWNLTLIAIEKIHPNWRDS